MSDIHGPLDFGNLQQSLGIAVREQYTDIWANRYHADVTALRDYVLELEQKLAQAHSVEQSQDAQDAPDSP